MQQNISKEKLKTMAKKALKLRRQQKQQKHDRKKRKKNIGYTNTLQRWEE